MRGERRTQLLLIAFGVTAAAFMTWSLWLIRTVGQRQAELAEIVALVSSTRELEPSLRELEGSLALAAIEGPAAVGEEGWARVGQAYAARAARIRREGDCAALLASTDACARRIVALGREELRSPGTPEERLARISEARGLLRNGLEAVEQTLSALLQSSAEVTAELDRRRRQLDTIAFVACLMSALATALMALNRRDQRRILEAERGLVTAHEALASRAEELQAANGRLRGEVEQRTRSEAELETRTRELERSNQELERFAYVASHDLQEPLRAVASHVQILKEDYAGKLDADADESIRHAVEGAAHMRLLIQDLLAYSRIGRGNEALQPVSAEDALSSALRHLGVAATEAGATILRRPLPEVLADPTQLIQLLQNLVGNAIKFRGDAAPVVSVSAERDGDAWTFCVRDNGIGIDPRHSERIFAPFERLHGRHEYPGTGIGLAICKKIVERHGGRIRVESAPGKGCAFFFTLAAAEEIAPALPSPRAPEPSAPPASAPAP